MLGIIINVEVFIESLWNVRGVLRRRIREEVLIGLGVEELIRGGFIERVIFEMI